MSTTLGKAVVRELAACNGPGMTADQLADRLGSPRAMVRHALSDLVFVERVITCRRDGTYTVGDPKALLTVG